LKHYFGGLKKLAKSRLPTYYFWLASTSLPHMMNTESRSEKLSAQHPQIIEEKEIDIPATHHYAGNPLRAGPRTSDEV
jgi:hypothetical protein